MPQSANGACQSIVDVAVSRRPRGCDTSIVPDGGWPVACGGNIPPREAAQSSMRRFSFPITGPSPVIDFRLVIAPVLASPQ